jgi:hypothetical protein
VCQHCEKWWTFFTDAGEFDYRSVKNVLNEIYIYKNELLYLDRNRRQAAAQQTNTKGLLEYP